MESQSDISSISSQRLDEGNQVPSIHIEQYIGDGNTKYGPAGNGPDQRRGLPRIFTVAQTLKDPLILNHIKPDYGSLGEFIGDINIGRDLLNQKKRKNDGNEDDAQEKKIKSIYREKSQQQLNKAFLDKSSSSVQKKIAGKMLVQNLFKDSFGMSLTTFENQNAKQAPSKNYRINLSQIDEIFQGKKNTIKKLQQNAQKKSPLRNSKQEICQQKQKNNEPQNWTQRQRIQIISQIKSKYSTLKRLQIKKECGEYKKLMPKTQQQEDLRFSKKSVDEKNQKQPPPHILQLNETDFKIEKLSVKPELMLYLMSQFPVEKLQSISLNQVRMSQQLLCFMIDVIKSASRNFTRLSIRRVSLQKTENVAVKIKQLLESCSLKELTLQYIDFQTKQFCVICLGVGSNTSLQILNFDNNAVDERACKSLELISKHCQNLKKISLKKNYLQPHHLSYFPPEAKAKITI